MITSALVNQIGDLALRQEQFFADVRTATIAQFRECAAYCALCKRQGFDPERDLVQPGDEVKIPWVTSNSFKKSFGTFMKLLRQPPQAIEIWTVSSATSGDPSIVGRTRAEVMAYREAYRAAFFHVQEKYQWDESLLFWVDPNLVLARSEQLLNGKLQPYGVHAACEPGPTVDPQARQFVVQLDPQTRAFTMNSDAILAALHEADEAGETVFIGGAVALIYRLYLHAKEKGHSFHLGERCHVQFGAGGWDGRKGNMDVGRPISRQEFIPDLCRLLGIQSTRFVNDMWGSTETSFAMPAHYSDTLGDFVFHELPWARVILRDPETLEPIDQAGRPGLLEVITPYGGDSYAGVAILVDDILELTDADGSADCGWEGQRFRFIGRAKGAEAKGCGTVVVNSMEQA